jgi:hypothetical protein
VALLHNESSLRFWHWPSDVPELFSKPTISGVGFFLLEIFHGTPLLKSQFGSRRYQRN